MDNELELVFIQKNTEDFDDILTRNVVELISLDFKLRFRKLNLKKAISEFSFGENPFLPVTLILKNNKVQSHILGDFDYNYLQNEVLKHL